MVVRGVAVFGGIDAVPKACAYAKKHDSIVRPINALPPEVFDKVISMFDLDGSYRDSEANQYMWVVFTWEKKGLLHVRTKV